MNRFFSWLVNKLRFRRLAVSSQIHLLTFGAIYYGTYSNWKHDPNPLIWVQYSGPKYTHGINIHYLNAADKQWLANTIYLIKKGAQVIDGLTFYKLLKLRRPSIVKRAYRVYFTNLLNMKLVSAGITNLDSVVYMITKDPWVARLNQLIKPSEMKAPPTQIAFSKTELQERIIEASNSISITKNRVSTTKKAPWLTGRPY